MSSKIALLLALVAFVISILGCAQLGTRPGLSVSQSKVHLLERNLDEQSSEVKNFVSTGMLQVWEPTQRISTTFLCVASRNPFRLKLEITHTWGLPLLHVLMHGNEVTVIDFYHHRTYHGQFGRGLPFFAKTPLVNRTLLWSVMRAFPELMHHGAISWSADDGALVVSRGDEVAQEIRFDGNLQYPMNVLYPKLGVAIRFSEFAAQGSIAYAKAVEARYLANESSVHIKIKDIIFNQDLNPEIFQLRQQTKATM